MGSCIRPGGYVLTEKALEICNLPSGSRIADIGCGSGGTLERLERTGSYEAVGLDYSEVLVGEALVRITSSHLVRGMAEKLPFKKGFFDALFCECVLSILSDRMAVLHECARVLKEGGFLIISDVFNQGGAGQGLSGETLQELGTTGLLTKEDIFSLLEGLGFSLLHWEENERLIGEFAAQMILAGQSLPNLWGCRQGHEREKSDHSRISYFLLVARRKTATPFLSIKNKRDGKQWTT